MPECANQDRNDGEVGIGDQGEPDVHRQQEAETHDQHHEHAHEVDEGRSEQIADHLQIVGRASHEVAGLRARVERLVHAHLVGRKFVPDFVLDRARRAGNEQP